MHRLGAFRVKLALCATSVVVAAAFTLGGCGGAGSGDEITVATFAAPVPLDAGDVMAIVQAAALSIDAPNISVAVTDRVGRILGVWSRNPAATDIDQNLAVASARTGAFMSSSQGPLSSRTLEFISTFHFPAVFGTSAPLANPFAFDFSRLPQQRPTLGVSNTGQGPLWQIFSSNRGAPLADAASLPLGMGLTDISGGAPTVFATGKVLPAPVRIDGTAPGTGLNYLPGGIPLYKSGRIVGGVGVSGATPEVCEFAAIQGAMATYTVPNPTPPPATLQRPFFFDAPPEGAIFLVGVLLPYTGPRTLPAGFLPGSFPGVGVFRVGPIGEPVTPLESDPDGDLITPRGDPTPGGLTLADVNTILDQGVAQANGTRAAIRLPLGSATKMVFAVCNKDGLLLGLRRMPDAPVFSIDVSVSKSRTMVYYANTDPVNGLQPADAIPGVPPGIAITTRTLSFLTQPFFPPGQDLPLPLPPGPLFASVAQKNQDPNQFNRLGNAPFRPGLQNGIIFFPGATALYKAGVLVGGLGVSGDGVEEDDFVTSGASAGFEAPAAIRCDNFLFQGVRLPYYKFPQLPGPGG